MKQPRKICYVSGTRADFGLMQSTLERIQEQPDLDLMVVATGAHLCATYGMTVREIEASGLPLASRIDVEEGEPSGALMARNIGRMLVGFVNDFERLEPDVVLVLGDRGEMLAAALAAIHLDIPVAHIHGGERSGTVDEPIRHAISKLAQFHFVASEESRQRLVRMGELSERIWVVGAPGLDGLRELADRPRISLCSEVGFDPEKAVALLLFHPVLQEAESAGEQAELILQELAWGGLQILALAPNSDAGSNRIRNILESRAKADELVLRTHLKRKDFVSWMAAADVMIGNSSSGIIEAATFGTPVVNIGSRQNLRQRNGNVIDVNLDAGQIARAVRGAVAGGRLETANVYGDGRAGERIARLLTEIDLFPIGTTKTNAY